MNIQALTVSLHASQDYGQLRCVGRFNNAINFLTHHQQLLTLHRTGRGLSPVGWEIDDADFDDVFDTLLTTEHGQLTPTGIELGELRIQPCNPLLNLTLTTQGEIALSPLQTVLGPQAARTGLFGRLGYLIEYSANSEVRELQQTFARWLQGEGGDWRSMLGKGPGLTPSNDDTLLGMLLVAHLDSRVDVLALPPFFESQVELNALTTLISANYLHYAVQGIFATPLHTLASGLLEPSLLPQAVQALLQVGHFSGADTLLGVWLGALAINLR